MAKYFRIEERLAQPQEPKRVVSRRHSPDRKLALPPRWFLGRIRTPAGKIVEPWELYECKRLKVRSLRVDVQYDGTPLDFTLIARSIPVVRTATVDLLEQAARLDVQRIPVRIKNYSDEFEIVNVLSEVDCIDESKSMFDKWPKGGHRPDLEGEYRSMYRLVIDPHKVGSFQMIRPKGFTNALLVSDCVKSILTQRELSGIEFRDVSGGKR